MGVLGRHALLMVTLHLRMTLTQNTVDTIYVIKASWVVIKFECIANLKKVSKDKNRSSGLKFKLKKAQSSNNQTSFQP